MKATLLLLAAPAAAQMLALGLQRRAPGAAAASGGGVLARRAVDGLSVEALVYNYTGDGYFANVTVGTPPQPQLLVVDSGTSDTYVLAYDAAMCTDAYVQQEYQDGCTPYTYNPNKSSTYRLVKEKGMEPLRGPYTASGDYFNDTLSIGGATLTGLRMGYATWGTRATGVLALGYATAEQDYRPGSYRRGPQPTVLDLLQAQGHIGTKAYSLYLDGADGAESGGALLLGGIDTGKFAGPLVPLTTVRTFPIDSGTTSYPYIAPAVNVSSLAVLADGADGTQQSTPLALPNGLTGAVAAVLDTGRVLSYVPQDLARALNAAAGVFVSDALDAFIDCNTTAALRIVFGDDNGGSVTVTVPAALLALDVLDQRQLPDDFPKTFSRTCVFAVQDLDHQHPNGHTRVLYGRSTNEAPPHTPTSSFLQLGAALLRALYTVVDLDHNQIALAQARPNSTTSLPVALPAGLAGLPTGLMGGVAPPAITAPATTATTSATATATAKPSSAAATRGSVFPVLAALACLLVLGL